jgi:hypothetical protein
MFEINELRETVRESYIGGVRTTDAGRCAGVDSAESGATFEINELCEAMRDDGARDVVAGGVAESSVNAASMQVRSASVLYQREDAARRAFNRADALVSIAQRYLRGDRPNRTPIEIALTISSRDLCARTADPLEVGEIGESFVDRDTARRLSCDAGIVELVEDDCGTPLSVGRKRRAIDGSLKRALQRRDQGCSFPGCTHRLFLEGHHIKHWADGGETSLSNAAQVCNWHHRHVHEYGYTVELGPDQRPQFRDPQGRLVVVNPARPDTAGLGWERIRKANAPLAIDASTAACRWDGTRAEYGTMVGHLLAADGLDQAP